MHCIEIMFISNLALTILLGIVLYKREKKIRDEKEAEIKDMLSHMNSDTIFDYTYS